MKNKLVIIFTLIVLTNKATGQSKPTGAKQQTVDPCESLKKENEALKVSLKINTGITTKNSDDIDFVITKVTGDLKTQFITIEFLLTNKLQNRKIQVFKNSKIVTIEGDVLWATSSIIAGDNFDDIANLNTNVPIKCSYTFPPTLPSNKYLKLFSFAYALNTDDYFKKIDGLIEFRDLEIIWK